VVLLDTPGGAYWRDWLRFVEAELLGSGYVSAHDLRLVHVTDDRHDAVGEVMGFYRNYHSMRFVEGELVLRMQQLPGAARLDELSREFADIVVRGSLTPVDATAAEQRDDDHVGLDRIGFRFDRRNWARLRMLIDALNEL
jgi:hypothetical protein